MRIGMFRDVNTGPESVTTLLIREGEILALYLFWHCNKDPNFNYLFWKKSAAPILVGKNPEESIMQH